MPIVILLALLIGFLTYSNVTPVNTLNINDLSTTSRQSLSGIFAAYNVGKFYNGPIARIRRSYDSVTLDFYADSSGTLHLNSSYGYTTVTSWLYATSSTAYVAIWYDQSGNNRDAWQSNTAAQPIYDATNKYIDFKPSGTFDVPCSITASGNGAFSYTFQHGQLLNQHSTVLYFGVDLADQAMGLYLDNNGYYAWWSYDDITFGASSVAPGNIVSETYDGTIRSVYLNGQFATSTPPLHNHNLNCVNGRIGAGQPSRQPSVQPSSQPSAQPSTQPSNQPSNQPSTQPSSTPTMQPSSVPTSQPSNQPSYQPSRQPSSQPSSQPSRQPSQQPTGHPSCQPSGSPSHQPTSQPSSQPSMQPSTQPSSQPSIQPTTQPSTQPSNQPSMQPSTQPSVKPSAQPSRQPSTQPSVQPSRQPSVQPSMQPTDQPHCAAIKSAKCAAFRATNLPTEYATLESTVCSTEQPAIRSAN